MLCPSCKKPIRVNKNAWETSVPLFVALPGIPLAKILFSENAAFNPPVLGWMIVGTLVAVSVLGWRYTSKKYLQNWSRYEKVLSI